ncbi:hypothetical protein AC1031_010790 [Aphanomyces cochlioides]|nr:hypothetical protein AC1031_010790 [Aphanomyces cochlioides]
MADPDSASSFPGICDWVDDVVACHQSLQAARIFISRFGINQTPQDLVQIVANATSTIEIIRLALYTLLLRHAFTNTTDPTFAFVGWNYLFDWVQGDREVVSFQGDVDTYDLISYKYLFNSNIKPVPNEISNSAAKLIGLGIVYVALFMACVAGGIGLLSWLHRLQISGSNLFFFNRVVGLAWVGRPLLILRGCTAILLLSIPRLTLENRHGLTKLTYKPRSFVETVLVASESTWLSYVVADIFLNTSWVTAPISSAICFAIAVILDVSSPLGTIVSGSSRCEVDAYYSNLMCASQSITNGSPSRLAILVLSNVLVHVGVVCLGYLFKVHQRIKLEKVSVLYSCAALTFLNSGLLLDEHATGIWRDAVSNFKHTMWTSSLTSSHGNFFIVTTTQHRISAKVT